MILIISIPRAGERMLPTTPSLSYPPPRPHPAVTACEEFKVQSFNVYKPFCVKTLSYVTFNYYCFCFPCKYFLCSYTAVCCPDRCPNQYHQFKIPYRPYRPSITLVSRNSFPKRTSTVCPISPNPQTMALNGFA